MCMILTIASAVASAAGQMQQASAARAQANYQAQVANNNAIIARQNAERLQQYGDIAADEQAERLKATRGAARARLAANGLLVDDTLGVTATGLQIDLAGEGEYDILKLRDRYAQQVRAAEVQGVNFQAEAGLQSLKASQQSPGMAAVGSLLSSSGKVYGAGKKANWWGGNTSSSNAYGEWR
jgi:hypothetical protein|tara:strand:+ start:426 stop:971 length:546 start_codon:yes stop_codon:yes gene_type:complete